MRSRARAPECVPWQLLCPSLCVSSIIRLGSVKADVCSPGWVHTGLTGAGKGGSKPAGAWTPEQTVDYMIQKVFEEGDFYVICPDNETSSVS